MAKLTCSRSRSWLPWQAGSAIPSETNYKETTEEDKAQASCFLLRPLIKVSKNLNMTKLSQKLDNVNEKKKLKIKPLNSDMTLVALHEMCYRFRTRERPRWRFLMPLPKRLKFCKRGWESCINMCVISFWAKLDSAIEREMRKLRKRKGNEILARFLNCFHVKQLRACLVFG